MQRSRMASVLAMMLGVALGTVLALAAPKTAAAAGEWCASFGASAAWDAASGTCTVRGPQVTLTDDITIGQDETLYVTSDVEQLVLEGAVTNHGAAAFWALNTESRGRVFNYGVVAAVGTFDSYGDFWNYNTLRIFETLTNYGVIYNYGEIEGAVTSTIANLGTISNVRRSRFASDGLINNLGTFSADCGAALTYDPAKFTGNTILGLTGCDATEPKATPVVRTAPNGDTLVLWNWKDNEGGAGIDLVNCQAITRLRSRSESDVEVSAVCSDRAGNRGKAAFVVPGAGQPPACESPYAAITVQLDLQPEPGTKVRFAGPYGDFLLDGSANDGNSVPAAVTFREVLPGTHSFAAAVPSGWWLQNVSCTPAANCQADLQHALAVSVQACDDVTALFTVAQAGSLRAAAYQDRNGDGVRGGNEPPQGGWWNELTTVAADGKQVLVASGTGGREWRVRGLIPGQDYLLCQKPQRHWTNTQPGAAALDSRGWACYHVTLKPGEEVTAWFGYTREARAADSGEGGDLAFPDEGGSSEYLFLPNVAKE